ncbi:MAG: hypothetical protein ACRDHZ_24615, partial [Ktedonobacteraceae bacterium]
MAIVEELFQGRNEILSDKSTAEIPYIVRQGVDEAEVKASVLAATGVTYAGMVRKSIEISEHIDNSTWKVLVRYERQDYPVPPQPTFSFDTGGGSQHITQSLETRGKYGPSASDQLGGAIGFDGQNVAGVDITVPVYSFSETHTLPAALVTQAFQLALFRA